MKKELDEILDSLPEFESLSQCFVHTDMGPHNAMMKKNGAIQMHISYMQVYGPYAVDSLWKILKFGIEQKETLWGMLKKGDLA